MRIRTLVVAMAFVLVAAPAHAGWFNWFGGGFTPPKAAHAIQGGFHKSDSTGRQMLHRSKEFNRARWGSTAHQVLKHPTRPLAVYLRHQ
jgi:hypothetical protein